MNWFWCLVFGMLIISLLLCICGLVYNRISRRRFENLIRNRSKEDSDEV